MVLEKRIEKRKREARRQDESVLCNLLRAIADRDPASVLALLKKSPQLARAVVSVGATREHPADYFFDAIKHYAYAGDTALHLASAAYQLDVVMALASMGADVRARNRRGAEPLHYACDGSPGSAWWNPDAQSAVAAFLISAGADPNAVDKSGVAPLHRAVRMRSTPAVRALLSHGADVRLRNGSGSTPLHLAVQDTGHSGSGAAEAREQQSVIIRSLLAHGARPTDRNAAGKSVEESATAGWIRALISERPSA